MRGVSAPEWMVMNEETQKKILALPSPAFPDEVLATISHELLLARYSELRAAYVKLVERGSLRDRSAILRMAGNIAVGLVTNEPEDWRSTPTAESAVDLARAILAEVDRG